MNSTSAVPAQEPSQAIKGNGRFFANQTYHFETLRSLGYIPSGAADLGEVLETVKLITEGDAQSWYAAWAALSDRVLSIAERTNDPLSKGGAYLRAQNYLRTAEFLLPIDDPKRPVSWEKEKAYFNRSLESLGIRYEQITVPYDSGALRALYLQGAEGADAKPLILIVGGFDSVLEELFPVLGKPTLDRGYSVLLYEGPGQGESLRKFGLTFTPEWECPTSAVLDEFLRTHMRPAKIVLIGMSLGGYLAPRAAAFDERINGLVAFDTCFDFAEVAGRVLAVAANPIALKNPDVLWGYNNARWTLGTKDLDETNRVLATYAPLSSVADRIRQDVLILAGTEDHFIPFHQTEEFEKALTNARSVTKKVFDGPSGGAGHCQAGNLTLVYAAVFDWLLAKFPRGAETCT